MAVECRVIFPDGQITEERLETLFIRDFGDGDPDETSLSHRVRRHVLFLVEGFPRVVVDVCHVVACSRIGSQGCLRADYDGPVV